MPEIDVNIWAVLLGTVSSMVIGSVWYHPKVFYNTWARLAGIDLEKAKTTAGQAMGSMFVGAFITNYVLAHVIGYMNADTALEGVQTGWWMWLGFIGVVSVNEVFFGQRPVKLWLITAGYNLVNLLASGVILALWK